MLPNGRRLGAHLALGHGLLHAADRAREIGASAVQVFVDNPTTWRRRTAPPADLPAFRDRLAAFDIAPLVIHAPYLVNLASPDPSIFERSVALLASELRVASLWGAGLLNLHIGSHRGAGPEAGVRRVAAGLRAALETAGDDGSPTLLILENGVGGGFGLGATVEELALLDRAIVAAGVDRSRTGYCLDTAHLWGAGYPIGHADGVDGVLGAFDAAIGLGRVRLVHLNDSRSEPGSLADRHEHIGAGRIGYPGMRRFLEHPGLAHATYILETPGMDEGYDAVNLGRVLDIAAGRPLADLPPEAFETRGGRSAPPVSGRMA